jgi:hypothetical protein
MVLALLTLLYNEYSELRGLGRSGWRRRGCRRFRMRRRRGRNMRSSPSRNPCSIMSPPSFVIHSSGLLNINSGNFRGFGCQIISKQEGYNHSQEKNSSNKHEH